MCFDVYFHGACRLVAISLMRAHSSSYCPASILRLACGHRQGIKMSKSIGNVTDPRTVIEGGKDAEKDPAYGADVLRLWVASVDFTADVLVGGKILAQAWHLSLSSPAHHNIAQVVL